MQSMTLNKKQLVAIQQLGELGRLISGSKGQYRYDNPKNFVVFNANIVIGGQKVWHGDIDITTENKKLINISTILNQDVYVLCEMDARFENEKTPLIEKFIYKVSGLKSEAGATTRDYLTVKKDTVFLKPVKAVKIKQENIKYNKEDFKVIGSVPIENKLKGANKSDTEMPYYNCLARIQ